MNKKFYLFILATMIAVNAFGYEKQTWNYETGAKQSNSSSRVQDLDIYYPETGEGPYPVFIWIDGNIGFQTSPIGKESAYSLASALIDTVLQRGYAVVVPNCHYAGEDNQPLPLHDCKAVVRFLRNNGEGMSEYPQNIDTSFIAVGGWSTGGLIATLMGIRKWSNYGEWFEGTVGNFLSKSCLVDAVVSWSGFYVAPENLASYSYIQNNIAGGDSGHLLTLRTFTALAEDPSPEVVFHGSHDGVISPAYAVSLYNWLQDRGADSEYYLINGQSHGLITLSSKYYYYGYMVNFLDRIRAQKAAKAAEDPEESGDPEDPEESGDPEDPEETEDIQNPNARNIPAKILHDGQLYIIRDNKIFNAIGAEVR